MVFKQIHENDLRLCYSSLYKKDCLHFFLIHYLCIYLYSEHEIHMLMLLEFSENHVLLI